MISSVLICQNPKCKGTQFEEVYSSQVTVPIGEEDFPESDKLKMVPGSGRFFYRCTSCGKVGFPTQK